MQPEGTNEYIELKLKGLGLGLISSSPSFDTEKFQLPRLPIVAR